MKLNRILSKIKYVYNKYNSERVETVLSNILFMLRLKDDNFQKIDILGPSEFEELSSANFQKKSVLFEFENIQYCITEAHIRNIDNNYDKTKQSSINMIGYGLYVLLNNNWKKVFQIQPDCKPYIYNPGRWCASLDRYVKNILHKIEKNRSNDIYERYRRIDM